jgi:alpha-galactosidase
MTGSIGNGDVEVDLGEGVITLRWPALGITFGPCRARVSADASELESAGPGGWRVDSGSGADRPGTWARWSSAASGVTMGVHVATEGPIAIVDAEVVATSLMTVDALTPLDGATDLRYERRLVDGYESWSYSGVRDDSAGSSFWNAAFVDAQQRALAFQALDGRRFCTRVANDGAHVHVDCGASPTLDKVAGTWGYRAGETPSMHLPLGAGDTLRSAPIAVAADRDPIGLIEQLASLAATTMDARRWTGPPPQGWESWYEYGLFVSADDVLANARLLRERYRDRPQLDLVQLDDGWQRTYGAWWPNERFPDDLGELVRELRALGCRPGLWIAPFRVQPDAPGVATEHPDWCIRAPDGAPLNDDRHGAWALDSSNPGAREWVRELGAQVRAWGFEMVKVDFCYLGAFEGGRHDARVTGIEALRRGFGTLVDALGDDVYVLGCGMPALPAVGICHGNRIGHDLAMPRVHQPLGHPVDEGWTGFMGIRAGARNLAARWAQAGRWYDVDPDVVMAWGADGADPAGYSTEEARALMTLGVVCGGPFFLADALAPLDAAGRAVLEHAPVLDLLGSGPFRATDVFELADDAATPEHAYAQGPGIPSVWTTERDGRVVAAFFNWGDVDVRLPVPDGLRGAAELWTEARAGADLDVPAHGVRVLAD